MEREENLNSKAETLDKMFFENDAKYIAEKEIAEDFTKEQINKVFAKIDHDFTVHYLRRVEANVLSARDTLLETNKSLKTQPQFRWMSSEVQDLIMRMDETLDRVYKLLKDIK